MADPMIGSSVADVTRIPAPRNGSFNQDVVDEPGVNGVQWEPAV
jgi:hypothetical protein